jgi:hypothetical protein
MPQDPNKWQKEADRGTEIHNWWYSLTTDTPEPPPCPPRYQSVWLSEAERMDPGGEAEIHLILCERGGQPLVLEADEDDPLPTLPDGASLVFRGTADRAGRGPDGKRPWVEDLKTGRKKVSPRSWQLQAYGLMWWVYLKRPSYGVDTSILDWFRDLKREGEARRRPTHLTPGTLFGAWQTFLKLRERVARREPPNPGPECGMCPVAGSCPALTRVPF